MGEAAAAQAAARRRLGLGHRPAVRVGGVEDPERLHGPAALDVHQPAALEPDGRVLPGRQVREGAGALRPAREGRALHARRDVDGVPEEGVPAPARAGEYESD